MRTKRLRVTGLDYKNKVAVWPVITVLYNNNNNNCKTSIVPLSAKRIELSGAPSGGVGQTHSPVIMQSSSTMIRWSENYVI